MNGTLTRRELLAGVSAAALLAGTARGAAARRGRHAYSALHRGRHEPTPTIRVHNYGRHAVVHSHISFFQPFAPGEVPGGASAEVRRRYRVGVTPAQQDQKPLWSRGGSAKGMALSFI
jgi:hypothetical protein